MAQIKTAIAQIQDWKEFGVVKVGVWVFRKQNYYRIVIPTHPTSYSRPRGRIDKALSDGLSLSIPKHMLPSEEPTGLPGKHPAWNTSAVSD